MSVVVLSAFLQACVTTTATFQEPASDEEAAQANLNLGAAYLRQGRPELALEYLQRSIDQDPELATAHSTIALAYDELGDMDNAEEHYRRATQLAPSNAAAHNSYAVFLCRQNRWEDAEEHFNRAANNERYATPAAALTNAGICAHGAGEVAVAEEYFRAALEVNPSFADALASMMELSFAQDQHLQARAFMQRLFAVQPPDARQLWLCFRNERQLGDDVAAGDCARQLRANFPESSEFVRLREFERDAGR